MGFIKLSGVFEKGGILYDRGRLLFLLLDSICPSEYGEIDFTV